MSSNDAFANLRKSKEEDYFRKMEAESVEKMRRQAELEAERGHLAEAAGVADAEILQDLKELGYTYQTVMLLHLVPLVQVAWIDGHVTNQERKRIVEASGLRGANEGSLAYRQLMNWLDHRPSGEFFQRTLRVIRHRLKALPLEEQKVRKRQLICDCTTIAAASGGFWGLGSKICGAEQRLLKQIAVDLEHNPETHGD